MATRQENRESEARDIWEEVTEEMTIEEVALAIEQGAGKITVGPTTEEISALRRELAEAHPELKGEEFEKTLNRLVREVKRVRES